MTIPGNTRVIYFAKQSGKGTPAGAPTHKLTLNGDASLDPARQLITLPETDASAQAANRVVVGSRPTGGWQGWLRSSEFAAIAEAIMGVSAPSGSNPNYIHTATPSQALPYYSLWDVVPGIMCTRYNDARFNSVTVSGAQNAGIQYQVEAVALEVLLNQAEPVAPAASASDRQLAYPDVTVTVGGSHPGTHDQFSITVRRNVTLLAGDNGLGVFDSNVGIFEVEGSFQRIGTNDDLYNQFHGGSSGATAVVTTVFTEALDITIAENANRSVTFDSNGIEYTAVSWGVTTDGSPVIHDVSFGTKRQAAIADNLTIVTKNGLATTAASPT